MKKTKFILLLILVLVLMIGSCYIQYSRPIEMEIKIGKKDTVKIKE